MEQSSYSQRVLDLYKGARGLIDPEDMRISAAEIASEADARIKELEVALKEAADSLWNYSANTAARKVEKALGAKFE